MTYLVRETKRQFQLRWKWDRSNIFAVVSARLPFTKGAPVFLCSGSAERYQRETNAEKGKAVISLETDAN